MPNWCENTLIINGDTTTLEELKSIIDSDEEGLLQAIRPLVGDEAATEAWGTKWDVSSEGLDYVDNGDGTSTIQGYFHSAWSPPVEAFQALADDWDSCYIELRYFEPGMGFAGEWSSETGDHHYDEIEDKLETTQEEDPILHSLIEDFGCDDWFEPLEDEQDETAQNN